MPSDKELYSQWKTQYRALTLSQAAETLASHFKLNPDSVRGRLSRYRDGNSDISRLKELATKTSEIDPSIYEQDKILHTSAKRWDKLTNSLRTAIFASDIHFPYARWDALELLFLIMQDLRVDLFTGGNDLNDNSAFGRWDDKRPNNGQRWSNDTQYMRDLEFSFYRQVKEATGADIAQVQGNHDNWWYTHLREVTPSNAESFILDYMQRLDEVGVLQFSKGYTENELWLTDDLVFWHGQFAGNKAISNAANTMKQFTKNGKTPSVVVGHTHRPSTVDGYQVGYNGRTFINAPCLSRIENVPYIKRNPQGWGLGFVYAEFDYSYHKLHRIDFLERDGYLVAEFKGKDYKVKVDKSQPKEY